MKVSRFKIFNYISAIIIAIFSIYAQYQEVVRSIYDGIPVKIIIKTLIEIYTVFYIPIFLILIIVKIGYRDRQSLKHTIISVFKYSTLLTISLIGTFIIALGSNSLYVSFISSLTVILIAWSILKFISYKKTLKIGN